jgi:hypothetical protein
VSGSGYWLLVCRLQRVGSSLPVSTLGISLLVSLSLWSKGVADGNVANAFTYDACFIFERLD